MRRLGRTNFMVNEIGFGGIPIQRVNQKEVNDIVKALLDNHINVIDTARGYTVSEQYIGEALKGIRENFYIFTKSMSRTYEAMKKDIEISLKNLQTSYIDLYQFHNVKSLEEYKMIMAEDGAYRALMEAKQAGKIKNIGMTSHNLDFLNSIIDDFPFDTIQFPYNIIETKAEELFERANKLDIGVIVMKPLAGGAINEANIAIKFILNNDNISVVIPGMESVKQVKENSCVKKGEYTEEELRKISNIQLELEEDFCRRCGYCAPCTVNIDIPSCFMFEGYYTRYGLKDWAEDRYFSLKNHASDCIECYECESKCPYNLPIVNKLKKVREIFNK